MNKEKLDKAIDLYRRANYERETFGGVSEETMNEIIRITEDLTNEEHMLLMFEEI